MNTMKNRLFLLLALLLPGSVLLAQNITVGESSLISKNNQRSSSIADDFEGFSMNTGLNIGYGRLGFNSDGVNYVPFIVDFAAGVHACSWLTTNLGTAAEVQWAPKQSNINLSVPLFAEFQFNFYDDVETDVYLGVRVGNAFKWYDCLTSGAADGKRWHPDFQVANLYAGLRVGAYIDGVDLRILEVTYEGQPWLSDGRHMLLISVGMGFHM